MAISVASSETSRTPEQERTGVMMSRRRGSLGEMDELQKLFEQLMGGEGEDIEGLEEFDWEKLWSSFAGEEEGLGNQEYESPSSRYPTMFGAPIRPTGFNRGGGFNYY